MKAKIRRHSGRKTPKLIKPKMKYDEIKDNALEPQEEYDDWLDYRDGFRDTKNKNRKEKEKKMFPYKRGGRRRCQK